MAQTYVRKPVVKEVVVDKPIVERPVVEQPAVEQVVVKEVVVEPEDVKVHEVTPAVVEPRVMKSTFVTNFSNEFAHEVFKPLLAEGENHSDILFSKSAKLPSIEGDKSDRFIQLARWAFIQWVGESK